MQQKGHVLRLALEVPLILFAFFLARAAQKRTLVISGHPGEIAVTDTDGHSYVEIQALVRLTNGSLSFNGNQIILTLRAALTPPSGSAPPASLPSVSGLALPNNKLQSFHNACKADFFFATDLPGKVDSSLLFFAS